jgi:hypothetical protein
MCLQALTYPAFARLHAAAKPLRVAGARRHHSRIRRALRDGSCGGREREQRKKE